MAYDAAVPERIRALADRAGISKVEINDGQVRVFAAEPDGLLGELVTIGSRAAPAVLAPPPPARATLPRTFAAMMAREARVMRKNFLSTFVRVLVQPVMFVFVFAYVLPKLGGGAMAGGTGGPTFAHMPVWAFLLAIVGGTVLLTWAATRTFTKRVLP